MRNESILEPIEDLKATMKADFLVILNDDEEIYDRAVGDEHLQSLPEKNPVVKKIDNFLKKIFQEEIERKLRESD